MLVVDGGITQKNCMHEITLGFSRDFGDLKRQPAPGAEITLYDDQGNSENYHSSEEGRYYLYGDLVERVPGRAYYIEIRWPNGNTYRSVPQGMPQLVRPESIRFEVESRKMINENGLVVERNYLNLRIDTPVNPGGNESYFIWRSDHVYSLTEVWWSPLVEPKVCYIQQSTDASLLYLYSGENMEEGHLEDFQVSRVVIYPFWQFFEKHFYNITQYCITREAFDYWEKVNEIAFPTGSIFDTPPAPIPGNIYNVNDPDEIVLGFFEVSTVDTIRTWTNREDLEGLAIYDRCNDEYLYQSWNDNACRDCMTLDDASTERPYYWGE